MTPLRRLDRAVARISDHVVTRPRRGVTHDNADDVLGTIDCDDALGFDPRPLLAALGRKGLRAVVIGQVAGILHGSQELTGDLDLLWAGDPANAEAMAAAFTEVEAVLHDDDGAPLPVDARAFGLAKVTFRSAGAAGDCCTPFLPWGRLDVDGVLDRAVTAGEGPMEVHYASLADLIEMRLASGRPKDLRRAEELRALARPV
jgi:hypothetical protein